LFSLNTCVMITKLTLTIEDEVIAQAKSYAQQRGQSLSKLVEAYFKILTNEKIDANQEELHPDVIALFGAIDVPQNFDWKKELTEAIEKKHGHEGIR